MAQEITDEEKNIAIALMIGWKQEKHPLGYYRWKPGKDKECLPLTYKLQFDTDANLQFEAMEFIESLDHKKYHYSWTGLEQEECNNFICYNVEVDRRGCVIWVELELDPMSILISTVHENRQRAVFEALYDFSNFLKTL